MIIRILLAAILIVALFIILHWFRSKSPEQLRQGLKVAALFMLIVVLIFLAATGRLSWLFALFAALIPLFKRLLPFIRYAPVIKHFWRKLPGRGNQSKVGQSAIKSTLLELRLNHQSGKIDGQILGGRFKDQLLSQLSTQQLQSCLTQWQQHDMASAQLLSVYITQKTGHPPGNWDFDHGSQPQGEKMSETEALAILGLQPPIDQAIVVETHRRLIQKLHPDRGGSNYLAVKINQAKDVLLTRYGA